MIEVGVLTSSRADFGIYLPLLKALQADRDFNLKLIVFGTHLSKFHGYTIENIKNDGFPIYKTIESLLIGDTPNAIASSYALTTQKFTDFWEENQKEFDVIFALGDRFEMAAAVAATIPFQLKIAHLHGGETTHGAIDNIYRHFISLASQFHFVSTENFANRLLNLLDDKKAKIFNVGSLSLENIDTLDLLNADDFYKKWQIDLNKATILVTVHPETVDYQKNIHYSQQIIEALEYLCEDFQIVITMPNADTSGLIFRESFLKLKQDKDHIFIIENFGTQSYFSCMKYAQLLIGNTSSGIIEAASFNKFVLNLGDRQSGRLSGENVIHLPFESQAIVKEAKHYIGKTFEGENIYFKPHPSKNIIKHLKEHYATLS